MASLTLFLLTLSLLICTTTSDTRPPSQTPPPPPSILNAAEALANSGYFVMSITLTLVFPSLPNPLPESLTIFSPPDIAFNGIGQPSIAHLLLHFSPVSISPSSLLSIPETFHLPSLSHPNHLTVTKNNTIISINNVTISLSPIYDDGFLTVYPIDNLFDPNFTLPTPNSTNPNETLNFQCSKLETFSRFRDASGELRSRGYSIMASFLDLQLIGFLDDDSVKLTVFAPVDEELAQFAESFLQHPAILTRHLVPCKIGWSDLDEMANGTVISKNVDGFTLEITKDEDAEMIMVNGVEINFPGMYDSELLVIHGIRGRISLPVEEDEESIDVEHEEF